MTPNYEIVSAPPGKPSILWIGKSGRKYRTLVAAKIDKAENAYADTGNQSPAVESSSKASPAIFIILFVVVVIALYKLTK